METAVQNIAPQNIELKAHAETGLSQVAPMKEGRWEWIIATICLFTGMMGLEIMSDTRYWANRTFGNEALVTIGTVHKQDGVVRRRPNASLAWHELDERTVTVSSGDTVFTGEKGIAELLMNRTGESATILPNSLVVLQVDEGSAKSRWFDGLVHPLGSPARQILSIQQGQVKMKLKTGSPAMRVQSGGKTYQIESTAHDAVVDLFVDPAGKSGLQVTSDRAAQVKLTETAGLTTSANNVPTARTIAPVVASVSLHPISPLSDSVLLADSSAIGDGLPIRFEWSVSGQPSGSITVEVEGDTAKSTQVAGTEQLGVVQLKPGKYRWRATLKASSTATQWIPFSVARIDPPRPIGPANAAEIRINGDSEQVLFHWSASPGNAKAEIAVKTPDQEIVRTVDSDTITINLKSGKYSWRTRALLPDGKSSSWSAPFEFTLIHEQPAPVAKAIPVAVTPAPVVPAPAVPAPVIPAPIKVAKKPVIAVIRPALVIGDSSTSTRMGDDSLLNELPVSIAWKPIPDTNEYTADVFGGEKNIFHKSGLHEPKAAFVISSLGADNYSYEVTAKLNSGEEVKSKRVNLTVELAAPILKIPREGAQFMMNDVILITWERTLLTERYQIQVSMDPRFSTLLLDQTDARNLYNFEPGSQGTLYARVRGLSSKRQSQWSTTRSFTVKKLDSQAGLNSRPQIPSANPPENSSL